MTTEADSGHYTTFDGLAMWYNIQLTQAPFKLKTEFELFRFVFEQLVFKVA